MTDPGERLLTAKDVADRLRVNLSTVYLWVEQGKLPFIDLSRLSRRRCVRFRESQLETFLRSSECLGQDGRADVGARSLDGAGRR